MEQPLFTISAKTVILNGKVKIQMKIYHKYS